LRLVSAHRCIGSMAMPIALAKLILTPPPNPPEKEGPFLPRLKFGGILAPFRERKYIYAKP
jgi:hypothetical protein